MRPLRAVLPLVAVVVALLVPQLAQGYANGSLPGSALAPIYNPTNAPRQVLAKGGPVEAWNTLNLCLYQQHEPLLYAGRDGAAYRPLSGSGFTQDYAWYAYTHGFGNLAAYPGTSNHGLGRAVDLGYPSWMRPLLDSRGPPLGWRWGEAPSEDWHVTHYGSYGWPNVGVSPAHPDLKLGAGGRCTSSAVVVVQRRLQHLGFFPHHVGGSYNQATRLAVYTYQVARKFKRPTGTVTRDTWIALRQPQAGRPAKVAARHAVAKLAGLKHGDRGPAVRQLSVDLAFVRHHRIPALAFYPKHPVSFFTAGLAGALRNWQVDNRLSGTAVYDLASQKLMGTSVRYWHRRFPTQPVKPGPKQPPPSPEHPAPRPVPVVAPSGSTFWADISGNNASVNLSAYRSSRHVLLAIKAVEGDGFRSDSFIGRWQTWKQLGGVRLAYDFARPSQNSCTAEARNFAGYVKAHGWHRGDVGVLDWEDPGFHGNGDAWVACWARTSNSLGVRAGVLYSYGSYAAETLSSTHFLAYWHAQYTGTISSSTAPRWARPSLVAIQYTDGRYGGGGPRSFDGIGASDGDKIVVSVPKLLQYAQR